MLNMMELERSLTGKPIEAIDLEHKTDPPFLHVTSANNIKHSQSLNHLPTEIGNHTGHATDPANMEYETSLDNLKGTNALFTGESRKIARYRSRSMTGG